MKKGNGNVFGSIRSVVIFEHTKDGHKKKLVICSWNEQSGAVRVTGDDAALVEELTKMGIEGPEEQFLLPKDGQTFLFWLAYGRPFTSGHYTKEVNKKA